MFRYFKYEIKGAYKPLMYLFIFGIILNLILSVNTLGKGIALGVWGIIGVIACTMITSSYWRFLYSDNALMKFSLPIKEREFLVCKIVISFIVLVLFSIFLYMSSMHLLKSSISYREVKDFLLLILGNPLFLTSLFIFISMVLMNFILSIFFSITLTKVSFRRKKFSGIVAFIVFTTFNLLYFLVKGLLFNILPYDMVFDLRGADLFYNNSIGQYSVYFNNTFAIIDGSMHINIGGTIFSLVVMGGLFFVVAYLLEKKVDI